MRADLFLLIFCLLQAVLCRLTEQDKAFLLSYLGEDFSPLTVPSDVSQPAVLAPSGDTEALQAGRGHVDVHEHDHTHKERHHHRAKGGHSRNKIGWWALCVVTSYFAKHKINNNY